MTRMDQYWMKTLGMYVPGPYSLVYCAWSWLIPSTLPSRWLVARIDSNPGMGRIWVGVWSFLPPPIWKAENGQWESQVVHSASAAAIFIGWYLPSTTPSSLPTNMARMIVGNRTTNEMTAVRRKASTCDLRRRCQAETASMTREPVTNDARTTWVYPQRNTGLLNRAQTSLSWGWWFGPIV